MRPKSVDLRDSPAGILRRLTAESGIDIGAVAHELHSHPAVTAAAMLAAAWVGSQAVWVPHHRSTTFPIRSFWRYVRERNLSIGGGLGTRTAEIVQDSLSR